MSRLRRSGCRKKILIARASSQWLVASSFFPHQRQGLFLGADRALELGIFDCRQQLLELRSGRKPGLDEIVAGKQGLGADLFGGKVTQLLSRELVEVEAAMAAQAIEPVQLQVLME